MSRQVIVLGSGAAGLAAATSAAAAGASVLLLEKASKVGGTTVMSGGVIWVPGNPWAAKVGVNDSVEEGLTYVRAARLGDCDDILSETYVRRSIDVATELEKRCAIQWRQVTGFGDYREELEGSRTTGRAIEVSPVTPDKKVAELIRDDPYNAPPFSMTEKMLATPEELALRLKNGTLARGRALVALLLAGALNAGVQVRTGVKVDGLSVVGGAVNGVIVKGEVIKGEVILATGGFEHNAHLVKTFLRAPLTHPGGVPTNEGDGLLMGMALGAALGNMSEAWWAPSFIVPGETVDGKQLNRMFFGERGRPGGIVVDQSGRRYANEGMNYNDFGRSMHEFDGGSFSFPRATSWYIFDAGRRKQPLGPLKGNEPDPSWLIRADTIDDLAAKIDIEPAKLRATLERYNGHAARGRDEDFNRGATVLERHSAGGEQDVRKQLRPLTPPFYAVKLGIGTLGTKGGLRIDTEGRVQRSDGKGAIPGLYAAGNVSANPFGAAYLGGGATIGPAVVFGWAAGKAAAAA